MITPRSEHVKLGDRERRAARPMSGRSRAARRSRPAGSRAAPGCSRAWSRQPLRRVDRDMRAGQEPALLERAAVDGVRQQVCPDAAVVEQGVALARGAVAGDGRPSAAAASRKSSRSLLICSTSAANPACPARVCSPAASSSSSTALTGAAGSPALPRAGRSTRSEPPWVPSSSTSTTRKPAVRQRRGRSAATGRSSARGRSCRTAVARSAGADAGTPASPGRVLDQRAQAGGEVRGCPAHGRRRCCRDQVGPAVRSAISWPVSAPRNPTSVGMPRGPCRLGHVGCGLDAEHRDPAATKCCSR